MVTLDPHATQPEMRRGTSPRACRAWPGDGTHAAIVATFSVRTIPVRTIPTSWLRALEALNPPIIIAKGQKIWHIATET
jgi:hypothetical protein